MDEPSRKTEKPTPVKSIVLSDKTKAIIARAREKAEANKLKASQIKEDIEEKEYTAWIVKFEPSLLGPRKDLNDVEIYRNNLKGGEIPKEAIAVWYYTNDERYIMYIFTHPVTHAFAEGIINGKVIPIISTSSLVVSSFLLALTATTRLSSTTIISKISAYAKINGIPLSKIEWDMNYNAYILSFKRPIIPSTIIKDIRLIPWIKDVNGWPLHTVPTSFMVGSPYSTKWAIRLVQEGSYIYGRDTKAFQRIGDTEVFIYSSGAKPMSADDIISELENSVIRVAPSEESLYSIEPRLNGHVALSDFHVYWNIVTKHHEKYEIDMRIIDKIEIIEKGKLKYIDMLNITIVARNFTGYGRQLMVLTKNEVINKLYNISPKVYPTVNSPNYLQIENEYKTDEIISNPFYKDYMWKVDGIWYWYIQMSKLSEVHKAFMALLYPWNRPSVLLIRCTVWITNVYFIVLQESGLKSKKDVYNLLSQYGTIVQISQKEAKHSLPVFIGSTAPVDLKTPSDNLDDWAVQFEYKEDALQASSEDKISNKQIDECYPSVVRFTIPDQFYSGTAGRQTLLKGIFLRYGPIVQMGQQRSLRRRKLISEKNQEEIEFDPKHGLALSQLVSRWLQPESLEELRKTSAGLAQAVYKEKRNPAFWKEKLETYYNLDTNLKSRSLNWGTMYTLFTTKTPADVLKEFIKFNDVVNLAIELGVNIHTTTYQYWSEEISLLSIAVDNDNLTLVYTILNTAIENPLDDWKAFWHMIASTILKDNIDMMILLLKYRDLNIDEQQVVLKYVSNYPIVFNYILDKSIFALEAYKLDIVENAIKNISEVTRSGANYAQLKLIEKLAAIPALEEQAIVSGIKINESFRMKMSKHGGIESHNIRNIIRDTISDNITQTEYDSDIYKWIVITPDLGIEKYIGGVQISDKALHGSMHTKDFTDILRYDPLFDAALVSTDTVIDDDVVIKSRMGWLTKRMDKDKEIVSKFEWFFANFAPEVKCTV